MNIDKQLNILLDKTNYLNNDNTKKICPENIGICNDFRELHKNYIIFRREFNTYIKNTSDARKSINSSILLDSFNDDDDSNVYNFLKYTLDNDDDKLTNTDPLLENLISIRDSLYDISNESNIYHLDVNDYEFIKIWNNKITDILNKISEYHKEKKKSQGGKKQKTRRMKKAIRKTRRSKSFRKK